MFAPSFPFAECAMAKQPLARSMCRTTAVPHPLVMSEAGPCKQPLSSAICIRYRKIVRLAARRSAADTDKNQHFHCKPKKLEVQKNAADNEGCTISLET